jgi:ribosomal-protein-alanine N-acetyltransferase
MSAALLPIEAAHAPLLAALHAAAFTPRGERGWTEDEFLALLSLEGIMGWIAASPEGANGAEDGEREVLGFVLFRALAGEAEIITIASRPDRRRAGVGGALLDAALATSLEADAETLFLEVAEDNDPALALYASRGFVAAGRRKGYYRRGDRRIDALVYNRPTRLKE